MIINDFLLNSKKRKERVTVFSLFWYQLWIRRSVFRTSQMDSWSLILFYCCQAQERGKNDGCVGGLPFLPNIYLSNTFSRTLLKVVLGIRWDYDFSKLYNCTVENAFKTLRRQTMYIWILNFFNNIGGSLDAPHYFNNGDKIPKGDVKILMTYYQLINEIRLGIARIHR